MSDNTIIETRPSWRFIQDPVAFRKKRMLFAFLGGILMAYPGTLLIGLKYLREPQALPGGEIWLFLWAIILVLICLLCGVAYHFFMRGKSFVIDRQGIHFSWHFQPNIPQQFNWSAVEVIRLVSISTLWPHAQKSLAFKIKGAGGNDAWHILPIATSAADTYIGEGHTHCLVDALAAAQGNRIEEIHADEIDKLPLLTGQRVIQVSNDDALPPEERDLGRRFLWVTLMIPLVIVAGATVVANGEGSPILLKVSGFIISDILIPGSGILLALAAGFYLRKEGNELVAALLCLLLGGASSFFLFMPVIYAVPEWLGETTKEEFSVIHADKRCQEWQGIGAPELAFSLYAEAAKRHYPEVGTKREFTVHRGPLWLVSIPGKEFGALYEEGAKIASGKCPPDAPRKTRQNQEK
jgi:hypothetical protein